MLLLSIKSSFLQPKIDTPVIQAETYEDELKLDFSSDEEEVEENDSLKSEDITLDYVLTRLSISGLDRTDQVYLQALGNIERNSMER